jgi:hypothetical protein
MGTIQVQRLTEYYPDEDPEGWIATFANPDDNDFQLVSPFPG